MAIDSLTRRYARALYQQAAGRDEQEAVYQQLSAIARALRAEPRLLILLGHPTLEEERKISALLAIATTALPTEKATSSEPFLRLMLRKGRVRLLTGMSEAFLDAWDQDRGIVRAHISSARQPTAEELAQIKQMLSRLMDAEVELESEVEPDLIGGMSARVGDRLVDGSVRGKLQSLRRAIRPI